VPELGVAYRSTCLAIVCSSRRRSSNWEAFTSYSIFISSLDKDEHSVHLKIARQPMMASWEALR
jgi:hypothetical protein